MKHMSDKEIRELAKAFTIDLLVRELPTYFKIRPDVGDLFDLNKIETLTEIDYISAKLAMRAIGLQCGYIQHCKTQDDDRFDIWRAMVFAPINYDWIGKNIRSRWVLIVKDKAHQMEVYQKLKERAGFDIFKIFNPFRIVTIDDVERGVKFSDVTDFIVSFTDYPKISYDKFDNWCRRILQVHPRKTYVLIGH